MPSIYFLNETTTEDSNQNSQIDQWDATNRYKKSSHQSNASFQEQKKALESAIELIDQYASNSSYFRKLFASTGAPNSGKSFFGLYILLYVISKKYEFVLHL